MKVTKTTIYRLEVERDCGCKGVRDYEDGRYQKGMADGVTVLCEKHSKKSEDAQEILQEMILDTLTMQAEQAAKTYAPMQRQVADGDTGGLVASGESVQAMGAHMPKPMTGPRRGDPTEVRQIVVDRPDRSTVRTKTAASNLGNLVVAGAGEVIKEDDIEISNETGVEAAEDENLSGYLDDAMEGMSDMLDQQDTKMQGVPQRYIQEGK